MKRGDIVRIKALGDGQPVGRYFYVVRVNKGMAYCYPFDNGMFRVGKEHMFSVSCLYKYSKIELGLKDSETGFYITYPHHPQTFSKEISKQLDRIVDEKPEIIMFFNTRKCVRAYCTYENATKVVRKIGVINELKVKISGLHYL